MKRCFVDVKNRAVAVVEMNSQASRMSGGRLTIEEKGQWLFGINAIINWLISVRGIFDPVGLASAFGGGPPNYPFMLRLWMGFVFIAVMVFSIQLYLASERLVTGCLLTSQNMQQTQ